MSADTWDEIYVYYDIPPSVQAYVLHTTSLILVTKDTSTSPKEQHERGHRGAFFFFFRCLHYVYSHYPTSKNGTSSPTECKGWKSPSVSQANTKMVINISDKH